MTFRIKTEGPEGVVTVEQAGPDVVIRLNGYGVVTFQADEVRPLAAISKPMLTELGVGVRVEE